MATYPNLRKFVVVGMILLFIGLSIITSAAQDTKNPLQTSGGKWWYVGGSGPGNYTKIQDAIDTASVGDTVFVYDESSPYNENVIINKSLIVIGEDKETVIIDGGETDRVVSIKANEVTICGFTLQNSGDESSYYPERKYDAGVGVGDGENWYSNNYFRYIKIKDNKIINNCQGIFMYFCKNSIISDNIITNNRHCGILFKLNCEEIIVTGNIIAYNEENGIRGDCVRFSEIYNNTITNNICGIALFRSDSNTIHNNIAKDNMYGFTNIDVAITTIYRNQFENNDVGLDYCNSVSIEIYENNFINNRKHATFYNPMLVSIIGKNPHWMNNYWQRHSLEFPKIIRGINYIELLISGDPSYNTITLKFRWYNIDRYPAQEPYNIPG